MRHWLAVDRCFPINQRADALEHAGARLMIIEGRPVHEIEVEAAVVICPGGHRTPRWSKTRVRPVEHGEALPGRPGTEGR